MARKILIVEDEPDVVRLLEYSLGQEGFSVASVGDGSLALGRIWQDPPNLLILDLMLPGIHGLEICRQIRRHDNFGTMPILILTARNAEADRVVGLEMGADDYVTKPFSMRELIARVRALLRRHDPPRQQPAIRRGELSIDPAGHSVAVSGRRIELSALEFRLLHHLANHPGVAFSRQQLLECVWGGDHAVTDRNVDVYIRRLREKIEPQPDEPSYVHTVHGVGYRFAEFAEYSE